jgi:cell division septal protein FtsQ
MAGGRRERGSRRRARAASAVVPFPSGGAGNRLDLAQVVPSGRSLLLAFGLVAAIVILYRGAHISSVFDVERVEVQGAPPAVAREVKAATKSAVGESLLTIDAREVEGTVRSLPSVAGASVDRAFPHTLVIRVAPERAVAVVRRGHSSWLVTGAGRVMREIETGSQRALPRLWLKRGVAVRIGGSLPAGFTEATRALAAVHDARLPRRVKAVRSDGAEMTLVLRRGPEIRLGEPKDLLLKLAVVTQLYRLLDSGTVYVDVSVPERPVASRYLDS